MSPKKTNNEEVAEQPVEQKTEVKEQPIEPNKPIEMERTKPYFNYEYMRNHGKGPESADPVIRCEKCQSEWFEYKNVQRVSQNYQAGPGQEPQQLPTEGVKQLIVMKCLKCGRLEMPKSNTTGAMSMMSAYGDLIALVKDINEG